MGRAARATWLASCSPTYTFILASVLPRSFGSGFIYLISYCIGIGISLLAAIVLGKRHVRTITSTDTSAQDNQPQSVGVQLAGGENTYAKDVRNGQMIVAESRLYHVVSRKAFGESTVTLTVPSGVSLYAFTFGG